MAYMKMAMCNVILLMCNIMANSSIINVRINELILMA